MGFEQIIQLITNLGFPIFVAVYYMIVSHKDSQNIAKALAKLTLHVENNTKLIDNVSRET